MFLSGKARLYFSKNLGDSWSDLALLLEIPFKDQRLFKKGLEARAILEWLESRERLADLLNALRDIDRRDLADALLGHDDELRLQIEIVEGVAALAMTPAEIQALYRSCLAGFPNKVGANPTIHHMVQGLLDIPLQHDGYLPILDWIMRLHQQTPDPVQKQRLEALQQSLLVQFPGARLRPSQPDVAPRPYLMVVVEPDVFNENSPGSPCYCIRAALWQGPESAEYLDPDSQTVGLDEVSGLLNKFLEEAAALVGDRLHELVVEFFLPQELLSWDVDQQSYDLGIGDPLKFGCHKPMVIRSLKRAASYELRDRWVPRWEVLQGFLETKLPLQHGQIHSAPVASLRDKLLMDMTVVGVGFAFVPEEVSGKSALLENLIQVGLPLICWPRQGCNDVLKPVDIEQELRALLHADRLDELVTRVQRLRQTACDDAPLGHHLSVLWDDPHRLPGGLPRKAKSRRLRPPT